MPVKGLKFLFLSCPAPFFSLSLSSFFLFLPGERKSLEGRGGKARRRREEDRSFFFLLSLHRVCKELDRKGLLNPKRGVIFFFFFLLEEKNGPSSSSRLGPKFLSSLLLVRSSLSILFFFPVYLLQRLSFSTSLALTGFLSSSSSSCQSVFRPVSRPSSVLADVSSSLLRARFSKR